MTGEKLRALRKRLGKTQLELADLVGVHKNTIARYERGELPIPEPLSRLVMIISKTEPLEWRQSPIARKKVK